MCLKSYNIGYMFHPKKIVLVSPDGNRHILKGDEELLRRAKQGTRIIESPFKTPFVKDKRILPLGDTGRPTHRGHRS